MSKTILNFFCFLAYIKRKLENILKDINKMQIYTI